LQKDMSDNHESDLVITPSAPTQLSVNGNTAYATVPTVLTSKHNGKPERELGSFAFAFEKVNGNWKITSWAWATR
jgi:ketosteroid isomerase-like protein